MDSLDLLKQTVVIKSYGFLEKQNEVMNSYDMEKQNLAINVGINRSNLEKQMGRDQ